MGANLSLSETWDLQEDEVEGQKYHCERTKLETMDEIAVQLMDIASSPSSLVTASKKPMNEVEISMV